MATVDGVGNATGKVHVVIFQENHVEQPDTVVHAASDFHSRLFQHTHARGRLTRVQHTGMRSLQPLHVLIRHGGNAAHALHDVQHQALRLQQAPHPSRDNHGHVARLHVRPVLDEHLHFHVRIEATEHFLGDFYSGQHAFFLDEQLGFSHGIRRNTAERSVVSIAYVLGKGQINQTVIQFFY